jgi:hypothetical protein
MAGSPLLDLPDELLLKVLHMDLEYAALVTCGQVRHRRMCASGWLDSSGSQLCRRMRDLMQAPALQYLLALRAAWLVDGHSKKWSLEDKIAMLRRYTQSWKTTRWGDRSTITFRSDDEYELCSLRFEDSGIVAERHRHEDRTSWLTYDRYPCPNRGIERSTYVWQYNGPAAARLVILNLSQRLHVRVLP